jgi:hypothetical protein
VTGTPLLAVPGGNFLLAVMMEIPNGFFIL